MVFNATFNNIGNDNLIIVKMKFKESTTLFSFLSLLLVHLGKKDGRTDRGKTVYPPPPPVEWGYNNLLWDENDLHIHQD